jgi:hypothetical protein
MGFKRKKIVREFVFVTVETCLHSRCLAKDVYSSAHFRPSGVVSHVTYEYNMHTVLYLPLLLAPLIMLSRF